MNEHPHPLYGDDPQWRERFSRNLLVEEFGEAEQRRLAEARVVMVGAGGLGSACASYLVAAGVGHLTLIDDDIVSLSNLQRQTLYTTHDLGLAKASQAAARLTALHPAAQIMGITERLTIQNAPTLLTGHDLVIDCSDNYAVRYVMDDWCGEHHTPLLYATAQGHTGQLSLFHTPNSGSYRALYPDSGEQAAQVGVLAPIVGVMGSLQASEALRYLTGKATTSEGQLLLFDGRALQLQSFAL